MYVKVFDLSNCLNDEIDTFTGSFKLRLDLTNLDKYLTYGFDGQRISGINNTNLIIFMICTRGDRKVCFLFLIQTKVRILSKLCNIHIDIKYISSNWMLFEKQL